MITMCVIPEQRKAVLSYPTNFRIPPREIAAVSKADVKQKWEREVREFIFEILRKWVIDRNTNFKVKDCLTSRRQLAVDKILLMLANHRGSRLHILCLRIVQDAKYFVELFPSKESRYYMYFKEVIAQVLLWCDSYASNYELFNRNLITTVN